MVKVLVGLKGSGKTKRLVELVRRAVEEEHGDVICIEKDKNLTYDIPYQARLIHAVRNALISRRMPMTQLVNVVTAVKYSRNSGTLNPSCRAMLMSTT